MERILPTTDFVPGSNHYVYAVNTGLTVAAPDGAGVGVCPIDSPLISLDLILDHYRRCPHSNLFTDIDLGEGSRMFLSGGGAALGHHSAAHETFWCICARRPQAWLAC